MLDNTVKISFNDGAILEVPLALIEKDHASYYMKVDGISYDEALVSTKDILEEKYELNDWVLGNMDIEDLEPHSTWHNKIKECYKEDFGSAEVSR